MCIEAGKKDEVNKLLIVKLNNAPYQHRPFSNTKAQQ